MASAVCDDALVLWECNNCRPVNMYAVGTCLSLDHDWDMQIYRITDLDEPVLDMAFVPGIVICHRSNDVQRVVWRRPRRGRVSLPQLVANAADAEQDNPDGPDNAADGDDEGEEQNPDDELENNDFPDNQQPDPAGDEGARHDARKDSHIADAWLLEGDSDVSEESAADGPDPPGPDPPVPDPPVPDPPVLVPAPPVPDPPVPDPPVPNAAARRDPRSPFPKVVHSMWQGKANYLRLSQTDGKSWQDMRGVCRRHGEHCSLSMSCRTRRPIGRIWAWLDYGMRPEVTTKEMHKEYEPSFEDKACARVHFEGLENVQPWIDAEASGDEV